MTRSKSPSPRSSTRTRAAVASTPPPAAEAFPTSPVAFETVRDEILAVPPERLVALNLDVEHAARCGLVAAERLQPLMPSLATLPGLDMHAIRHLSTYAMALLYAHEQAMAGESESPTLAALLAEAGPLRERMLASAELLVHFGLVAASRVAAIRSGLGHADTTADLLALGVLFQEVWEQVHDKVPVTRAMIERAITLNAELQRALGQRGTEPDPLAEPGGRRHVRAQAFALFAHAYAEAQRGTGYLRWSEGDAQRIVPSLYSRRRKPSRTTDEPEELDDLTAERPEPMPEPTPTPVAETAADAFVTA